MIKQYILVEFNFVYMLIAHFLIHDVMVYSNSYYRIRIDVGHCLPWVYLFLLLVFMMFHMNHSRKDYSKSIKFRIKGLCSKLATERIGIIYHQCPIYRLYAANQWSATAADQFMIHLVCLIAWPDLLFNIIEVFRYYQIILWNWPGR